MNTIKSYIDHLINDELKSEIKEIYSTGTDEINTLLKGVMPGELCVLFGDIASGKTALSLQALEIHNQIHQTEDGDWLSHSIPLQISLSLPCLWTQSHRSA